MKTDDDGKTLSLIFPYFSGRAKEEQLLIGLRIDKRPVAILGRNEELCIGAAARNIGRTNAKKVPETLLKVFFAIPSILACLEMTHFLIQHKCISPSFSNNNIRNR